MPQKSQTFLGLFRVPQFPLYLRNSKVLSHETSQSPWFFSHVKDHLFKESGLQFDNWPLGPKRSPDFRETGPRSFRLRLNGETLLRSSCCNASVLPNGELFSCQTNSCSSRKNSMVKAAFSVRLNESVTFC